MSVNQRGVMRMGQRLNRKGAPSLAFARASQNCAWLRLPWGGEAERGGPCRRDLRDSVYQEAVSRGLKDELLYLEFNAKEDCLYLKIRGGMLRDAGDCVAVENGTDREIGALVKLLKLKCWQGVELSGSYRFRELAVAENLQNGIQVVGYQMSGHLRRQTSDASPAPDAPVNGRTSPAVDEEDARQEAVIVEYLQDILRE